MNAFLAGTIAPEELRHILSTFGEVMDQAEIEEFLVEADLKCPDYRANGEKTGLINYFAFVGLILDIPELEIIPPTVREPLCTIHTI
jgi:Ca2+-binding EF-hand superfamily protein